MQIPNHDRFIAANQDLQNLLRRAARLANGKGAVTERDLLTLMARLLALAPEIGDAARGEILDAQLLGEIAVYVKNFASLQRAVEQIRDAMVARRIKSEIPMRDIGGPPGWDLAGERASR